MDVQTKIPSNQGYFQEKFGEQWIAVIEDLKKNFSESLEEVLTPDVHKTDIPVIFVKKADAIKILKHLKEASGFSFFTDYTATDEETTPRFNLVIHLMHLGTKARIRIKIRIAENETMPTLTRVWDGADWAEREIYDMFGIRFDDHPDLRRILMDMRWEGHPLRKDYPLRGYQVFLTPEPLDPELLK